MSRCFSTSSAATPPQAPSGGNVNLQRRCSVDASPGTNPSFQARSSTDSESSFLPAGQFVCEEAETQPLPMSLARNLLETAFSEIPLHREPPGRGRASPPASSSVSASLSISPSLSPSPSVSASASCSMPQVTNENGYVMNPQPLDVRRDQVCSV
ncbi:unnamed protein product [Protopolystoma xenopodis]|uniref:Uncharacterized protein n=1 Tax=Protopolystoma xenopodis TaxID=117903 RepID=A0A448X862_9PLAT|nr:unnamed protein product [Protopolystoma xenopodis]